MVMSWQLIHHSGITQGVSEMGGDVPGMVYILHLCRILFEY